MQEKLFVAKKPTNISSANFLNQIKMKFKAQKLGYSGTLDPFASGVIIVAFGKFTKLFRFLDKSPKKYRATLWLGAKSETLDTEAIEQVNLIEKRDISFLNNEIKGQIHYFPPKFSAKKINGKKAYKLARSGEEFQMKESVMEIYSFEILSYMHPFLNFEVIVSEGAYIRSLGDIVAKKLGCDGTLSSLERLSEGKFVYDNEKALNAWEYLALDENIYTSELENIKLGKKLQINDFFYKKNGIYKVSLENEFAVIQINDDKVQYQLNRIPKC